MKLELELDIELFFDHFNDIEKAYFKNFTKNTKRRVLRILIELVENIKKYGSKRKRYANVKIYHLKEKLIINSGNLMSIHNKDRISEIFQEAQGLDKQEIMKRYNTKLFEEKDRLLSSNSLGVLKMIGLADEFYFSIDEEEDNDEFYLTSSFILR